MGPIEIHLRGVEDGLEAGGGGNTEHLNKSRS